MIGMIIIFLIGSVSATINFNDWVSSTGISSSLSDRLYIAKYDKSVGTTTLYENAPTSYDIFTDDAEEGDMIYFGWLKGSWKNLNLTIDTGISASDVGITWYWLNTSGEYTLLNVTSDGTNNFTTTGNNIIEFEVPNCWTKLNNIGNTHGDAYWIVANLSYVNTLTEGGHINAKADGGNYAINLFDGNFRMSDIYSADVANGWGKVTNIASYYLVEPNLIIGKTGFNTNFTIRDYELVEVGYPNWAGVTDECNPNYYKKRIIMQEQAGDFFNIGVNSSDSYRETSYLKWNALYYGTGYGSGATYNKFLGTLNIYSSVFVAYPFSYTVAQFSQKFLKYINSITSGFFISGISDSIIKNNIAVGGGRYLIYDVDAHVDNIILSDMDSIGVGQNVNLSNIDFGTTKQFVAVNPNFKIGCINCKFADFDAQTVCNNLGNEINIYYEMDIGLYNKTYGSLDFNISVVDSLGTQVYNGDYSSWGKIIPVYFENQAGTKINYNPYTFIISAEGYNPYWTQFNVTGDSRKLFLTTSLYPFEINGTLVISQGKGIKIVK